MARTQKRPGTRATRTADGKTRPHRLIRVRLNKLVEEATVDCHDETEQVMGLLTMIEDNLGLPFETRILGVPVTVERVHATAGDDIVAVCRRGGERQPVRLLDLPLPSPRRRDQSGSRPIATGRAKGSFVPKRRAQTRRRDDTPSFTKARPAATRLIVRLGAGDDSRPMITTALHLLRLFPFPCVGRRRLALENLALRQQFTVYKRTATRPHLRSGARLFRVRRSRVWTGRRAAPVIVALDAVLR